MNQMNSTTCKYASMTKHDSSKTPAGLLAIDPGPEQSALCYFSPKANPPTLSAGIFENKDALMLIKEFSDVELVIEMIASYGMPVGAEVFETCVWIGRFMQAHRGPNRRIFRKDVKLHLCGSMKANDAAIRQRLIDLYGAPGTKKKQGFTYGLTKDMWQAFALAVTASESQAGLISGFHSS